MGARISISEDRQENVLKWLQMCTKNLCTILEQGEYLLWVEFYKVHVIACNWHTSIPYAPLLVKVV